MSWFEAYILWQMSGIKLALGIVFVVALMTLGALWITGLFYHADTYSDERHKCINRRCVKGTIPILILVCCLLVLDAFTPDTQTLLKIIATKKGIDAIQSDAGTKYLNEVDKAVSNGLKVLNQEIEKKLDKKEVK